MKKNILQRNILRLVQLILCFTFVYSLNEHWSEKGAYLLILRLLLVLFIALIWGRLIKLNQKIQNEKS